MKTLDQRINELKPGQSIRIGGNDETWTTVERTGNGKKVRFIRHTKNSFKVFQVTGFNEVKK